MAASTSDITPRGVSRVHGLAPALLFFGVTFAFSWLVWLPLLLRARGEQADEVAQLLLALGIGGPSIMGFILTARAAGRQGVARLWRQGTHWRVGPAWYAGIILGPGLAMALALTVGLVLGGQTPSLTPWLPAIVNGLLAGLFEEFGWSGFAFPALRTRYGLARAGALVGVAVALWHIPFFFIPELPQASSSFVLFLLVLIPARILFGWIVAGAGGSVLLAILFHASANAWTETLSINEAVIDPVGLTLAAIIWLTTATVLFLRRRAAATSRSDLPQVATVARA
jgi:membrane protease YdiL (CAAX protease family)